MMLRSRAAGQRLVASRTAAGSRRIRNRNISACNEIMICRHRSAVTASAHQKLNADASYRNPSDGSFFYNRDRICDVRVSACSFSSSPAPDFMDFEGGDSEPLMSPQFESDSYSPPIHHPNSAPPKPANKDRSGQESTIPKQSVQAARILFQTIAPHVEFRTMHQLMKQLTKSIPRERHHLIDNNDSSAKKRALKRRLGLLFDKSSEPGQYSWSVKTHLWLEPILYQFMMGKFMDNPDAIRDAKKAAALSKTLPYQSDKTYPPNINRVKYEKNVNTLIEARNMSLDYPMFWNAKAMGDSGFYVKTGKKKNKKQLAAMKESMDQIQKLHLEKPASKLKQESENLLEVLMHKLPQPHFEKLMKELERFAEVDGNLAEKKRKSWYIEDDNYSASTKKQTAVNAKPLQDIKPKDAKQNKITVLGNALSDISRSHSHLVAVELGRYFYVDLLVKTDGKSKSSAKQAAGPDDKNQAAAAPPAEEPNVSDSMPLSPQATIAAIRKNRKLSDTEKAYEKLRNNFVERLLQLQHEFASWEDMDDDAGDDEITDDGDISSDLQVKQFQREQMNYKADERMQQKEALAETLLELQKMGLRKDDDGKKLSRGRRKKGTHLRFTAVRIEVGDCAKPSSELTEKEAELEERIVFINNLPIDTTQQEIDEIYSRCGPLESVQLYNLRPDLDPGPLSKKQLEERQRKQRLSNQDSYDTYQLKSRQRPRTPVYGILRFQTAEGFNLATSPEMTLFGCVIRRHPVHSIKPHLMKTLYLENVPKNLLSIELEYKLARLLHPHQMHIMQDGMRGVNNDGYQFSVSTEHEQYSEPSSCEVKFEDFHAANKAYQWMKGEAAGGVSNASFMESDDCEVHWFRTPVDKMKYWTRELNF